MRRKSGTHKEPAEKIIEDIRRATRKHYSAEEKIRIGNIRNRTKPNCQT